MFITTKDNVPIIELGKVIDFDTASKLATFFNVETEKGQKYFIIDMTASELIDSAGIGAIVTGITRVKILNGKIIINNCSGQVYKILYLVKMHLHCNITKTIEEALNIIQK